MPLLAEAWSDAHLNLDTLDADTSAETKLKKVVERLNASSSCASRSTKATLTGHSPTSNAAPNRSGPKCPARSTCRSPPTPPTPPPKADVPGPPPKPGPPTTSTSPPASGWTTEDPSRSRRTGRQARRCRRPRPQLHPRTRPQPVRRRPGRTATGARLSERARRRHHRPHGRRRGPASQAHQPPRRGRSLDGRAITFRVDDNGVPGLKPTRRLTEGALTELRARLSALDRDVTSIDFDADPAVVDAAVAHIKAMVEELRGLTAGHPGADDDVGRLALERYKAQLDAIDAASSRPDWKPPRHQPRTRTCRASNARSKN